MHLHYQGHKGIVVPIFRYLSSLDKYSPGKLHPVLTTAPISCFVLFFVSGKSDALLIHVMVGDEDNVGRTMWQTNISAGVFFTNLRDVSLK